jgi:hypothetical protein
MQTRRIRFPSTVVTLTDIWACQTAVLSCIQPVPSQVSNGVVDMYVWRIFNDVHRRI